MVLGSFLFITQYLQLVMLMDPMRAGLWMAPSGIAFALGSMAAPILVRQFKASHVVAIGLLLSAAGFAALTQIADAQTPWLLFAGMMAFCIGLSPIGAITTDLVMGAAPPERAGAASAISETSFEVGGALGIAVLGSLFTFVYGRTFLAADDHWRASGGGDREGARRAGKRRRHRVLFVERAGGPAPGVGAEFVRVRLRSDVGGVGGLRPARRRLRRDAAAKRRSARIALAVLEWPPYIRCLRGNGQMLQSLWNEYGTEALMALGGAFLTALIMRLKAWKLGDLEEEASFVRQFLAYTVGYAAALAAVRAFDGYVRYAAVAVAASLALAVTINGRASLFSRSYVLSFCVALASGLALWALYAVMLHHYGIDLLAPGHAKS